MKQMEESAGWYRLALGALCVWRVSHLLHAEDGPWDAVASLRRAVGHGMVGRMLDCFYCVSIWVALPFAVLLGATTAECLLLIPALSAAAILAERATTRPGAPQDPSSQRSASAWYHEEEPEDVVLWKEAHGGRRGTGGASHE